MKVPENWKHWVPAVWHEVKLLVVGSVFFVIVHSSFSQHVFWQQFDRDFWFWTRTAFLGLAILSVYRWINNQSKWQPQFMGGRWLAAISIGFFGMLAAIAVFAIMNLDKLVEFLKMLRQT